MLFDCCFGLCGCAIVGFAGWAAVLFASCGMVCLVCYGLVFHWFVPG